MRSSLLLISAILSMGTSVATLIKADWSFVLYDTVKVMVGDTIVFTWTEGYHDVWIHPSLNCDDSTGAIMIAPPTYLGSAQYTFQESDGAASGKEMFFTCNVGEGIHCNHGVNQRVMVFTQPISEFPSSSPSGKPTTLRPTAAPSTATSKPTFSPTQAPTALRTVAPTALRTVVPTASPSVARTLAPTVGSTSSPTVATEPPTGLTPAEPEVSASSSEAKTDSAAHSGGLMIGCIATLAATITLRLL